MASGLKERGPSRPEAGKGAIDTPVFRMLVRALDLPDPKLTPPASEEPRLPRLGEDKVGGPSPEDTDSTPAGSLFEGGRLGSSAYVQDTGLRAGAPPGAAPAGGPAILVPAVPARLAEVGTTRISPSAAKELLTGKGPPPPATSTTSTTLPPGGALSERTLPTSGAIAPPIVGNSREKDQDQNKIDDRLDAWLREVSEKRKPSERIRILVTLLRPYTRDQLKAFLELGGEIRHTFEAVRYGFSGMLSVDLVDDLAAGLGPDLNLIEPVMPVPGS